jgi:catechol 2,3-dioxygenase-like lactoylglutathione lyase family enzyme
MLPGMTISRVQLLSVPVTDQDRARDFYVDVLGMTLVRENPMGPDQRWVEVAPKGADTSITLVTWFPTMPPGSLKGLVLETDDLDGDLARLTSLAVPVEGAVQEAPWGRFVTFNDPDGNGIVLQASASAAGDGIPAGDEAPAGA